MSIRSRLSTPRTRLVRALRSSDQPDPLFPILMHTLERGLRRQSGRMRESDETAFDQAFDRAVARARRRNQEFPRESLERFVRDYRAIPDEVLRRVVPERLMKLNPDEVLKVSDVQAIFEGLPPAGSLFNLPGGVDSFPVPEAPVINKIIPQKESYEPGETIKLMGSLLNPQKAKITVHGAYWNSGTIFHGFSVGLPSSMNASSPSFALPGDLIRGVTYNLHVRRESKGKVHESNVRAIHIKNPEPLPEVPQPVITEIAQGGRPGGKVVLTGTNLLNPGSIFAASSSVRMEPMDIDGTANPAPLQRAFLNQTQMELLLPVTLKPGLYRIAIMNSGGNDFSGVKMSEWATYQVAPHDYRVNFLTMYCKDESDPEWPANDELVTTWAIGFDNAVFPKISSEYKGFHDDKHQHYNAADSTVFSGEISRELLIATTLLEWDGGDVKAATGAVQFVAEVASGISLVVGSPTAAKIFKGVAAAGPLIQKIVTFFAGESNFLGERGLRFDVVELQKQTQNSGKKFGGELWFENDDDTGSYRLTYEVVRHT